MAKIARVNFQKVVDVLAVLESYWGGVRYIRSVLVQKGEGVAQISLVGEGEDLSVPDRVSEWIANASSKQNSDSESFQICWADGSHGTELLGDDALSHG
jgi:hypothetical protein